MNPREQYGMTGASPVMQEVYSRINKVKKSDISVLITGESGTGKDLVAKALYEGNSRFSKAYAAINVTQFPAELLSSELFGYTKNAFTGASSAKQGVFRDADQGTLFLDEIAQMSPDMQVKILRVLEDKRVVPVGGNVTKGTTVNFRLVAASSKPLIDSVNNGTFRLDLYHRLNQMSIALPPLRDREADVCLLSQKFIEEYSQKEEFSGNTFSLAPETYAWLASQNWPGNVRQLRNLTYRAMVLSDGELQPKHYELEDSNSIDQIFRLNYESLLPALVEIKQDFVKAVIRSQFTVYNGDRKAVMITLNSKKDSFNRRIRELGIKLNDYTTFDNGDVSSSDLRLTLAELTEKSLELRRSQFRRVLGVRMFENGGNISQTAEAIGLSRIDLTTLKHKLKLPNYWG